MDAHPDSTSSVSLIKDQLDILAVAEGLFQSCVLFALLRLRIFERLGDATRPVEKLAAELKANPETLARVLNAGVMLKLLEVEHGSGYRAAPAARSVLVPAAGENYLGDWIRLQHEFCVALLRLDEAVLASAPTIDPAVYLGGDPERTRRYVLAMHNYASGRGKELADYLDTTGCKTLLDLGCGAGTYAFHLGMRNEHLELYLADLPAVLAIAKEVGARYPIDNPLTYLPVDATKDEIPGTYDLILVSNMLHCFSDEEKSRLLQRLYRALNPGGSLVVQAQYLQDNRFGGRWPIYVDLNLLCTTAHGRNHTVAETRTWLEEAGFDNINYCAMSIYGANSFLRGYKAPLNR